MACIAYSPECALEFNLIFTVYLKKGSGKSFFLFCEVLLNSTLIFFLFFFILIRKRL